MIITFLGHRTLPLSIDLSKQIQSEIEKYTSSSEEIIFYCGGIGDFDRLCAKVCLEMKKKSQNCELLLITPYINPNVKEIAIYDAIIYPPIEKTPLKFAISHRNRWMIDKADVIIAYIDHSFGGAYDAIRYAQRKKKRIINLANKLIK